jgi:hypothetical protein
MLDEIKLVDLVTLAEDLNLPEGRGCGRRDLAAPAGRPCRQHG